MINKVPRRTLFRILRDKLEGEYFIAEDAIAFWLKYGEEYTGEPVEPVARNAMHQCLSRLVDDYLLAKPRRGIFVVRTPSDEELQAPLSATQIRKQDAVPKVRSYS